MDIQELINEQLVNIYQLEDKLDEISGMREKSIYNVSKLIIQSALNDYEWRLRVTEAAFSLSTKVWVGDFSFPLPVIDYHDYRYYLDRVLPEPGFVRIFVSFDELRSIYDWSTQESVLIDDSLIKKDISILQNKINSIETFCLSLSSRRKIEHKHHKLGK